MELEVGLARTLHLHGHSGVIRQVAEEVDVEGGGVRQLVQDLIATMSKEGGTGIAAPQIGVSQRLVVYRISKERAEKEGVVEVPITALANPVLTPIRPEEMEEGWEACLSVPGQRGMVPRYKAIHYKGFNLISNQQEQGEVSGFHARLLQHEVDHLDGILYTDKMTLAEPWQREDPK
jgi:peptide deformylase